MIDKFLLSICGKSDNCLIRHRFHKISVNLLNFVLKVINSCFLFNCSVPQIDKLDLICGLFNWAWKICSDNNGGNEEIYKIKSILLNINTPDQLLIVRFWSIKNQVDCYFRATYPYQFSFYYWLDCCYNLNYNRNSYP